MLILTWLITFLLVLDCLILVLLVLIQLPKKEAGMGQAFGGSTTDALFGAGSGTALTKLTKYAAGLFFGLTLMLSLLHGHLARAKSGDLRMKLTQEDKLSQITPSTSKPSTNTATATVAAASTNQRIQLLQTNAPTPSTNVPVEKSTK